MGRKYIPRDISWLSFNGRVLQEAADQTVPLISRIKFLGIFSNNLDEFFRVRVAGLKRALLVDEKEAKSIFFEKPQLILDELNSKLNKQQKKFDKVWMNIQKEMSKEHVYIKTTDNLSDEQQKFVKDFYINEVESDLIPILLDENKPMPYIRDKSLYLGVAMKMKDWNYETKFAIIEIPTEFVSRFTILPSPKNEVHVILLEDIIKFNLPYIFSFFGFDDFKAHAFKITRDAEFDLDNDINTDIAEKIAKAVKNRRKGKPTRFVFDENMSQNLVEFLIKKIGISKKDSIIPGQKIHNFKDFMNFPNVFKKHNTPIERTSFLHPALANTNRIADVIKQKDILLAFPYHSFDHIIDLLREAAIDPDVTSIQITAYRLASKSKIGNALVNAHRNGKQVTVMLELRARFDEQHNLYWKERFETEGIKVLVGIPNKKVHAKLGIIKKRVNNKTIQYGFVSTGNINEKTAKLYGDYCLLTSNRAVMADINKVFQVLRKPKLDITEHLVSGKGLLFSPTDMRDQLSAHIDKEIQEALEGRKAHIIIKINSLSDKLLIKKLYEAADAGVQVQLIIRGIYCAVNQNTFKCPIEAISIVDEYLEHARVLYFYQAGQEAMYISSADWMTRNLDYRIEAAIRINDKKIKAQLLDILNIQLKDNVKARRLNNLLSNEYITNDKDVCRSQIEIYNYLKTL
ncbi:polyphosphate kinase 1 [Sphingobacterium bovistauri]|uniref:Polyphosphate kinase n=1 Tax=Sphingobacterium bovistauri TaxID=2781959 RepID=A0ABS7Z5T2_9SPHI|nr:polyphosphate kinase 1 [Sphingobacterium bovistauri]MCA5005497.1 polyphosphate kinase 1 [Sphingobacterium bovistauri]